MPLSKTLGHKQEEFGRCLAEFITWIYGQGWAVRIGEVYRPPYTAAEYAKRGIGVANSVHTLKLAADLVLSIDGKVTFENSDYAPLAQKWLTLHDDARAGHYFASVDSVHFSFEHNGVS